MATKLAIAANPDADLVVVRCRVDEEHADNDRFAADCVRWFGRPIVELKSEKYGSSIYTVFAGVKYIAGIAGAACTRVLKREVREKFQRPDDLHVFGFTADEPHRVNQLADANNALRFINPALDAGLTHEDCVAMIGRAGIEIPVLYRMGYKHNNCVGCVKGGAGYWNRIRVDFPETFERMAKVERLLGAKLVKGIDGVRVSLDELPAGFGDMRAEPAAQCGIFCEMAEGTIATPKGDE